MIDYGHACLNPLGYDKIPALDPTAFDRLKGLFADEIESEYFDAVELVKESRGC